jgi:hypothetical protein
MRKGPRGESRMMQETTVFCTLAVLRFEQETHQMKDEVDERLLIAKRCWVRLENLLN